MNFLKFQYLIISLLFTLESLINKLILSAFLLSTCLNSSAKVEVNANCYLSEAEDIMYMDMFPWNQTQEQVSENFDIIYNSKKRLDNRVFFDGEKFLMPFKSVMDKTRYAVVPESFIESVVTHIETALKNDYVDHINFSDMGHNHFYIPKDFYSNEISKLSMVKQRHVLYEKLMKNNELLMLYHTAEQYKFFDESKALLTDRSIQKRFYTRNLLGKNNSNESLDILFNLKASANGVSNYKPDEYKYWGAGFSFSSTAKGCFSYMKDGKKHYFDLSADDIGYYSSSTDDDYM